MIVYREAPTLARDLGIPLKTLYAVSNSLPAHYRRVSIPKRDGGARLLSVPDGVLKKIQRAILSTLLVHMPVSPHATAYRFGGCALRNAAPHVGRGYVLKLDIRSFYDSILYSAVKDAAFPPEIYAEPLRVLLSILCYFKNGLPQGAPSSPAIANLVLRSFDGEVGAWCAARGVAYTRYCDDLTFSAPGGLEGVYPYVRARLETLGFSVHPGKHVLVHPGQRQCVTGLTLNDRLSAPPVYRRALRQAVHYCRAFGVEDHLRHIGSPDAPADYLRRLLGQLGFWLQADPGSAEAAAYRTWLLEQLRAFS